MVTFLSTLYVDCALVRRGGGEYTGCGDLKLATRFSIDPSHLCILLILFYMTNLMILRCKPLGMSLAASFPTLFARPSIWSIGLLIILLKNRNRLRPFTLINNLHHREGRCPDRAAILHLRATLLSYCENAPRPILPVLKPTRIIPILIIILAPHILPDPHPSIHNVCNDVHMLLEHEKVLGPWRVLRSTDIREMLDGKRRGHQVGMVDGEGELLERAGKVQVEGIVWSERWPRLGWLRLGLGHDADDCVAYILELVLLGEGECEVASRDGYVVGILKKSSGQVTINEKKQISRTQGDTYCG